MDEKLIGEILELKEYVQKLVDGDLTAVCSAENGLCDEVKRLHANLNHLAWQMKRVSEGDFNQRFTCFGKDSEPMNMIVHQMRLLAHEETQAKENEVQKRRTLNHYTELLERMGRTIKGCLIVVDETTKEVLFCSEDPEGGEGMPVDCGGCRCRMKIHQDILDYSPNREGKDWERIVDGYTYYEVHSYPVDWHGRKSFAHLVEDMTEQRVEERHLESEAYRDAQTGIYNERFFKRSLRQYLEAQIPFSLCYIEIDGLQWVKDAYGHGEGESYVHEVVGQLKQQIRQNDVIARLGEGLFGVVFINGSKYYLNYKMETLYQSIYENPASTKPYHAGFSFGIAEFVPGVKRKESELYQEVEQVLDVCKQEHPRGEAQMRE